MKNKAAQRQLLEKFRNRRGFALTSTKGFLLMALVVAVTGFMVGRFVIGEGFLKKSAAPVRRWHQTPSPRAQPVTPTPNLPEETIISEPIPETPHTRPKRQQPKQPIASKQETTVPEPSENETKASSSEPKPAPARQPTEALPAPKPSPGKYTIQVGVFENQGNSQSLAEDLKGRGYQARVKTVLSQGNKIHKVRLGSFDSREAAEKTAQDVKRQGYEVIIITEN